MVTRGEVAGKGTVREFGTDVYTAIFKVDNQQRPTA